MANVGNEDLRPAHTGRHWFWGIIGAGFGVAVLAAIAGVSVYFYNNYVPAATHAQLQQQVTQLLTHVPQVRPNGSVVMYGVGPDGQPTRTVMDTGGIYDELHGDFVSLAGTVKAQGDAMKAATDSLASALKTQADNQKIANENLAAGIASVNGKFNELATRVGKLETAQVAPAPVQQPAPQATPQSQAPANQAPAATSQAAPADQPGPQVAQGGDVNLVIPKWMKIQIDGEHGDNGRQCQPPRQLKIDFKSPKCVSTGRVNQWGKPIINCPNMCV
jgi:hypothetical protein